MVLRQGDVSWLLRVVADLAVGFVALIQVAISGGEMLFWRKPKVYGRLERFGFSQAEADKIAPIIANAGLYNAFLAAGLVWSILGAQNPYGVKVFFLACVAVAGVYGAATLRPTTVLVQTLPALLAGLLVWRVGPTS